MKTTNFQKRSQEELLIITSNVVSDVKIQKLRFQEAILGQTSSNASEVGSRSVNKLIERSKKIEDF